MEDNLKWHSGFKTKAWFRITLKKDVIFSLCIGTILNEIKRHTSFEPVIPVVAQSADPNQTVWFEMQNIDYGTKPPELELFILVRKIWVAMSNVYGPLKIEMENMTCLPFFEIEKIYEDQD